MCIGPINLARTVLVLGKVYNLDVGQQDGNSNPIHSNVFEMPKCVYVCFLIWLNIHRWCVTVFFYIIESGTPSLWEAGSKQLI